MDAATADAINRRDVTLIAARLDALDLPAYRSWSEIPWYDTPSATTLLSDDDDTRPDRAWIVGHYAAGARGIAFDGAPADCDWDNFFSHFRAAILARRDTESSTVRAAEIPVRRMV